MFQCVEYTIQTLVGFKHAVRDPSVEVVSDLSKQTLVLFSYSVNMNPPSSERNLSFKN